MTAKLGRLGLIIVIAASTILFVAGAAFAYWLVGVNSGPQGSAKAASLSSPMAPTATVNGSTAITIGWTLPGSQLAGAQYKILRTTGPGSPATVCTVASAVSSCQDTTLSPGTAYGYSIMAVLGTNWQSSAIPISATTAKTSPTIATTPVSSSGDVGSAFSDSATLTGSVNTNGETLTFRLYNTNSCAVGGLVATVTGTLSGGAATSSAGVTVNAVGTYFWQVTYAGDAQNNGAVSTCGEQITVSKATTTTSLSLSAATVTYGNESAVTFTSSVTPEFAGSTPTGTIAVKTGATTLCTITLPATTCTATNTALATSGTPYTITATYSGDSNFITSTSTSKTLTISLATSSTSLSLSAATVSYGNEATITFTSNVTPQFAGTPTGTVSVKTGATTLCTITLPSTTCQTTSTALGAAGTAYSVTASYNGDANFASSNSSASSLTVNKDATTTTVSETPTSVAYGNESTTVFTASVTAVHGEAIPNADTITVSVNSGAATCTIALPGTTCGIGNTALAAGGPYTVIATFNGDTNLATSSLTASTGLTVTKATTSTSLSLSASSVTYGNESTITFTSGVTPQFAGSTPSGTVTVKSGATTLCAITLPGTTCNSTDTALAASATAYSVTATYGGDGNFTASTSGAQNLTVNKATTTFAITVNGGSSATIVTGSQATLAESGLPGGAATGTVTLTSGSTLCTFSYPANTSCQTATSLAAGTYTVSATFTDADGNFTNSTATNTVTLTVIAPPNPTALSIQNHTGTAGKPDQGDTITITWPRAMQESSFCSTWTNNSADPTLTTEVDLNRTGNGNTTFSVPSTPCSGSTAFNIGGFNFGVNYIGGNGSATSTFVNSTISYNHTTFQLVITLGTPGGQATIQVTTSKTATYTPSGSITDTNGIAPTTAVSSTAEQF